MFSTYFIGFDSSNIPTLSYLHVRRNKELIGKKLVGNLQAKVRNVVNVEYNQGNNCGMQFYIEIRPGRNF